ncbi:MAG TPA: hypothetical protein VFV93_08625 [Thermomicrobiales bacterium]|nr:hypothetical protein [Thermomicrobiales bacterium]
MIAQSRTHAQRELPPPNWTFPRKMLEAHLWMVGLFWLALLVLVAAIAVGNAIWASVNGSFWDDAVSSLPQWAIAVGSGYLAYNFLPAMIALGRTRREFGRQALAYSIFFSVVLALLVVVGFLLEKGLYAVMDWPQGIDNGHIYSTSSQIHLIFAEYLIRFLVWSAAGFAIGAGFYRSEGAGGIALALGWIPVAVTEFLIGTQTGSPIVLLQLVWEPPSLPALVVIVVGILSWLAAGALSWRVICDIPIRSKAS